jgi:2-amino-4-hydroxy-6-hydroxymethyldihydropteridine diphosphokinase/dihydropteroate synthase
VRNRIIAIGVGSNLGSPINNLRDSLFLLKKQFKVLKVSGIYESDALTPHGAPEEWNKKFLNAAVLIEISGSLDPFEILKILKKIEKTMGRQEDARWSPRIIDLDILFWNDSDLKSELLCVPHQDLYNRPFALLPLLEIWNRQEVLQDRKITWAEEWVDKKEQSILRSKKYIWPQMMGVLNLTPDSFSDGGLNLNEERLAENLLRMQNDGAEIFDFGAESTRPNAIPVSDETELKRLSKAIQLFYELKIDAKISIDCRKAEILSALAEKFDFEFINDVEGFQKDEMVNFAKQGTHKLIVMHSLSVPPRRDLVLPNSTDPVEQIINWWNLKRNRLIEIGIDSSRLILDPGIGFGKSPLQNLYLLKNVNRMISLENNLLLGYSRKSVFELFGNREAALRDEETAVVTSFISKLPISILRVHDVAAQKAAWIGGGYFEH